MKLQISWKRLSLSLLLISIALGSYLTYRVFSSPSGQIGSIEGGGFCQGNYTVYNNTVDKLLYAMNCNTGVNDIAASNDFGAMFTTLAASNLPQGGEVHLRGGLFNVITTANFEGHGGIVLSGSGSGATVFNYGTQSNNATMLMSKTGGLTMVEASAGHTKVVGSVVIKDLALDGNCKGGTAIDFSMMEVGGTGNLFENIRMGSGCGTTTFSTAMIMDGQEDAHVSHVVFEGAGNVATGGATVDIHWVDSFGNPEILASFFGGATMIVGSVDNFMIRDSTIQTIKLGSSTGIVTVDGGYWGTASGISQNNGGKLDLAGFSLSSLQILGGFYSNLQTSSSMGEPFIVNSGVGTTISTLGISHGLWQFNTGGAVNWLGAGVTVTKSVTGGNNHVRVGTTPTGFPFTVDGNNNF